MCFKGLGSEDTRAAEKKTMATGQADRGWQIWIDRGRNFILFLPYVIDFRIACAGFVHIEIQKFQPYPFQV